MRLPIHVPTVEEGIPPVTVRPNPTDPATYRCDICGRIGYWQSHGFSWQVYGPMEGDGLHSCSDECRATMPDPEAAFKKLFEMVDFGEYQGRWAERRHYGLLGDAPPRAKPKRREDEYAPTESTGGTIPCPQCQTDNPVCDPTAKRIGAVTAVCVGCGATLGLWADVTYSAAVVKAGKQRRVLET